MNHSELHHKAGLESRPILGGKVNFPLCLAPMVGLSHVALRMVLRSYLPASAFTIWPTEMLNSRRLPDERFDETPEAFRHPDEVGMVPQILGNDETYIAPSVRKLMEWGAEAIDINMGCPVQKALRHNYGVSLMGDPKYAAEVVRITVKSSPLPVSVKLRAGTQGDFVYLLDFVQGLVDQGASWVTLHPRTAEQKRRGFADWKQIQKLRESVSIPIIGNGDVQVTEDVHRMRNETGADMVMAGRALAARPWMLWQLAEELGNFSGPSNTELLYDEQGNKRSAPRTPEEEAKEYGRSLRMLLKSHLEFLSHKPDLVMRKMRFHIRTTHVWLDYGHSLYAASTKAQTPEQLDVALVGFFKQRLSMCSRTQLRE